MSKRPPAITDQLLADLRVIYELGEGLHPCPKAVSRMTASRLAKLNFIVTKVTKVYSPGAATTQKILYVKTTYAGRETLRLTAATIQSTSMKKPRQ